MSDDYVIYAHDLYRTFKDKATGASICALDHISLSVPKGKMTAIIGPDGAGKTTFLRMVCGLLAADSGDLAVLGLNINDHAQNVQDRISYMPQKFGLYEDLTVAENMDLYADLHGIPKEKREKRFERLLHMTGLSPFTSRLAGKLSGGMKQKLGLACTLVRSPDLLLLDEPTVGVDPLSRRELWEIIGELVREEQLTVLVTTAYMEEAELCEKVIVLYEGKILADTTPAELKALAAGRCFRLTPPAGIPSRILQAALLDDRQFVLDSVPEGGSVRFMVQSAEILKDLKVLQYFPQGPEPVAERLEDGFMLLLRSASKEDTGGNDAFAIDYRQNFSLEGKEIDIEVKNLVRKFGDFTAVDNTSFQVHKGEIFGLLGPNGAGKTTTFRMLCGLLPSTSGFLSVAGLNLRHARTQARANIGYVAQKFSLYGAISVDDNLRFYGGVYGLDDETLPIRVREVKEQFGLMEMSKTPAEQLPGGYKQRLSMAAALMHKPKILFLDEPTSGIDPLARRTFWRQITALAAAGTTIIITTHFMEEAEYCDRIMIQDQGKMLALGTPEEIRKTGGRTLSNMNEAFIAIVEQARAKEA